ncbi:MAG: hypothetical protein JWM68_441 [Verrucomicrobiales bacterium]|nr:hypothetical protein [Verrucomicrobiales bacterium]
MKSVRPAKLIIAALMVIVLIAIYFWIRKENAPLAVVRLNGTTAVDFLSLDQNREHDLCFGNGLQKGCRFLLRRAFKVRSNLPEWLIGVELKSGVDTSVTWCVTRTRFSQGVPLSANLWNKVQINLVPEREGMTVKWGQQINTWTNARLGNASEVYTLWKLPIVNGPTLHLEVFEPSARAHGQKIFVTKAGAKTH